MTPATEPTPAEPEEQPDEPAPPPPVAPAKVKGKDGKQYPATKPGPKSKPPTGPPRHVPPPVSAKEWSEFFARVAEITEFAKSITRSSVPKEMTAWQLNQLLRQTAQLILATVARLSR